MATSRAAALVGVFLLSACSAADTIVALNVSMTDEVKNYKTLHVKLVQGSQSLTTDFDAPTKLGTVTNKTTGDDGKEVDEQITTLVPETTYFKRITLSDSWNSDSAALTAELRDAIGRTIVSDAKELSIDKNGTVAVFVKFSLPSAGGTSGAGGTAGAGGTSGAGGSLREGTAGSGGSIVSGGTAGVGGNSSGGANASAGGTRPWESGGSLGGGTSGSGGAIASGGTGVQ